MSEMSPYRVTQTHGYKPLQVVHLYPLFYSLKFSGLDVKTLICSATMNLLLKELSLLSPNHPLDVFSSHSSSCVIISHYFQLSSPVAL